MTSPVSAGISLLKRVLFSVFLCPLRHLDVLPPLSLLPPYLCSWLPAPLLTFTHKNRNFSQKMPSEVLGWTENLQHLGTPLPMVANGHSISCLHLSVFPPTVFPFFHRLFPTPLYHPVLCLSLSVFVPLPHHSSRGEHSSQSRGDRGLVLERPLQQERVLSRFPVALQLWLKYRRQ